MTPHRQFADTHFSAEPNSSTFSGRALPNNFEERFKYKKKKNEQFHFRQRSAWDQLKSGDNLVIYGISAIAILFLFISIIRVVSE